MIIGIPKEIKANENRVSLIPVGVELLRNHGHEVLVEVQAGVGSGFADEDYVRAGAKILESPGEIYDRADMIMKVKEPLPAEYGLIRENQIVFTYFHFVAAKELTQYSIESKCVAIAYDMD